MVDTAGNMGRGERECCFPYNPELSDHALGYIRKVKYDNFFGLNSAVTYR